MKDHLLSINNDKGGGVDGCPAVSVEFNETFENDYDKTKNGAFNIRLQ